MTAPGLVELKGNLLGAFAGSLVRAAGVLNKNFCVCKGSIPFSLPSVLFSILVPPGGILAISCRVFLNSNHCHDAKA
jgi:hypothetical protein